MHSHEILREAVEPRGVKHVASVLEVSTQRVYQWIEPPPPNGSGTANPLDRVEKLVAATSDRRIIDWVAQRAGGYFVQNAHPPKYDPELLMVESDKIIKEFANMITLISTSIIDGKITHEEAAAIREKWQTIQSVTEAYVQGCEAGKFRPNKTSSKRKS